jgi:hypothetical protein
MLSLPLQLLLLSPVHTSFHSRHAHQFRAELYLCLAFSPQACCCSLYTARGDWPPGESGNRRESVVQPVLVRKSQQQIVHNQHLFNTLRCTTIVWRWGMQSPSRSVIYPSLDIIFVVVDQADNRSDRLDTFLCFTQTFVETCPEVSQLLVDHVDT